MESDSKTATDLLPCPFCGGEARSFKQIEGRYAVARYSVSCDGCGLVAFYEVTEAEAIVAWNARAERYAYEQRITGDGSDCDARDELIRDLWSGFECGVAKVCDSCPSDAKLGFSMCSIEKRMHELGIEVGE